jgi:hypothetical protein
VAAAFDKPKEGNGKLWFIKKEQHPYEDLLIQNMQNVQYSAYTRHMDQDSQIFKIADCVRSMLDRKLPFMNVLGQFGLQYNGLKCDKLSNIAIKKQILLLQCVIRYFPVCCRNISKLLSGHLLLCDGAVSTSAMDGMNINLRKKLCLFIVYYILITRRKNRMLG